MRTRDRNGHTGDDEQGRGDQQSVDDREPERKRQHQLARVEAHAGRDREARVGMMDAVEPPERRHAMIRPMPAVGHEIERGNRARGELLWREVRAVCLRLGMDGDVRAMDAFMPVI